MRYVEREIEAQWQQGQSSKQRKVWAVTAMKPKLTQGEYDAAVLAVKACAPFYTGAAPGMEFFDRGWKEETMLGRVDAARTVFNLRQAVFTRTGMAKAPMVLEQVLQLETLPEIAGSLALFRSRGEGREREPDARQAEPMVRRVLVALANFYDDCGLGVDELGPNRATCAKM
jgi:hypothetical protein